MSTLAISTGTLTAGNISAATISTNFGFFSTISSGSIYGRHIGDGSLLTGLPAGGLTIIPPFLSTTTLSTGFLSASNISTNSISTNQVTSAGISNSGLISTVGLNVGSLSSINISTLSLAAGSISTIILGAERAFITNLFVGTEDFGSALTATSNITQTGGTTVLAGLSVATISTSFLRASNISTNSMSTNFGFFSTISTGSVYGRHIGDGSLLTNLPIAGITSTLSTQAFFTSSISTANITSIQGYISSLTVDYLAIGSNYGYVNLGDVIATSLSSIAVETQTLTTSNLKVGTVSSLSFIAFPGLQQGYAQSVLAEQSTGTGLQELLIFRGSSASDRIRMQTTGSIVFEPGVGARVFPAALSNVTPAMIINASSNVGIGIASPTVTLDVAGTGRFQMLSTQQIFVSSISTGSIFGRHIGDGSLLTGLPAGGLTIIPPVLSTTTLSTGLLTASNISTNSISTNNLTVSNLFGNGLTVFPSLSVNTISTNSVIANNISTASLAAYEGFFSTFSNELGFSQEAYFSTIFTENLTGQQAFLSSLIVNSLQIGETTGFITMGDVLTNSISTNTLNSSNISNVGNLSNGGSATFFSNGFTAASPSTTNAYPYASFKINNASTNTLTPVTPLLLMTGTYGGSIAGGLTQGVGSVLSLGTIPDGGATQEGYRLTGSNSAFYGNVNMQGNNFSNVGEYLRFSTGSYMYSAMQGGYTSAFLDIVGTGGDGQLRLINGSAEVALRANSDLGLIPASGYSIVLNGPTTANYNLNMNNCNISNVNFITTTAVSTNTISTNNLYASQIYGANGGVIGINSAVYYQGNGIDMGGGNINQVGTYYNSVADINMTAVAGYSINHTGSNINLNASSINMRGNVRIGTISSQSFLAYPGLQQGYAQTVIAEQSTGTGLQELLIFRGSSASDRIRMQTTGFICFETGVGARTFPSVGSNATPSWMIDVNGCVGVGLIPSGTQNRLDVAGQGRFQTLSTTSIQAGSMNLSVAFV
jgi:hypothetical protein